MCIRDRVITVVLLLKKVRGAILLGIVLTTLLAIVGEELGYITIFILLLAIFGLIIAIIRKGNKLSLIHIYQINQ